VPDFPIIDAHAHLYDPAAIGYPWMATVPMLNMRHASAEYTAAIGGIAVEKLVFVEVDAGPGLHLAEARWIAELAKTDPRIGGMVASLPLEEGAAMGDDITAFAKMPLARAVRRLIQKHVDEPGWCLQPAFVNGVKAVGRHGLAFELCIYHPQMGDAIELVRRCPEVRFVLDHLGKPGIKDGLMEPWRTQLRELAELPNVVCKISGAVTEADHQRWTYDQVAPYVTHAIEVFGFDRVMFGGDWPVVNLASSYQAWVALLDRVVAGAAQDEVRRLYRDNAAAFYRL
jgi:L-fuconolactonase